MSSLIQSPTSGALSSSDDESYMESPSQSRVSESSHGSLQEEQEQEEQQQQRSSLHLSIARRTRAQLALNDHSIDDLPMILRDNLHAIPTDHEDTDDNAVFEVCGTAAFYRINVILYIKNWFFHNDYIFIV